MKQFASVLVAYLLAAAVLWAMFNLLVRACRRAGFDAASAPPAALVGVGLAGYVAFFIYLLSPKALGLPISIVACTGLLAYAIWSARANAPIAIEPLPFLLALAFGVIYLSIEHLFAPEPVAGLANLAFFETVRPGDNDIPMAFADAIYKAKASLSADTSWSTSDRPPLQTGFALLFTPLRALFGNSDACQGVGTLLQVSIFPALWWLGQSIALRRKEILLSIIGIAGSGFVFFNSVYVWPKLLTVTFFLIALAAMGRVYRARRKLTLHEAVLAAAAATIALLAHGGIAFSLLALALLAAATVTRFFSVSTFGAAVAVAIVLYLPWAGYTHFVDPGSDRLLKMHLTGGESTSPEPFAAMLARSYRDVTLARWLDNRLQNLDAMAGSQALADAAREIVGGLRDPQQRLPLREAGRPAFDATKLSYDLKSLVVLVRIAQREHVVWSLGLLNLAWPLLLLFVLGWTRFPLGREMIGLLVLNALTVAIWITLEFNPGYAVNTHASFAMIIIGMLTAIVVLYRVSPLLGGLVCAAHVALAIVIWVLSGPGIAFASPGINWLAALVGALTAGGVALALRRAFGEAGARTVAPG